MRILTMNLLYHSACVFILLVTGYVSLMSIAASVIAANQERKIWRPDGLPSLSTYGYAKVFFFNMMWMAGCLFGCVRVLIRHLLTLGRTDVELEINRSVEDWIARAVVQFWVGDVKVVGRENLPEKDSQKPAPVYICNHASQIDAAAVYFFDRRFKWVAKGSVLFLPGVGQVMWLGGHVLINRTKGKNKSSVSALFAKSNAAIQSGIPMFFFPQGTRRIDARLDFKDGAFIVAQTNRSDIIPISLEIPRNVWNDWYPLSRQRPVITLTIHKPIKVTGKEDREMLKKQCMEQIYSVLPPVSPAATVESSKDK